MDLIVVKPFLGFLVLFGFLYLFALTPILVNGLTDGTCFSNESLPLFQFTPGHYEPEPEDKPLRPERCSSLCADAEYPLAAIVSQVYCLCGDESTINLLESTSNLTAEECDLASNMGALKVYKGEILHAVSGLNLTVNPSVGFTQEPLNLTVSLKTGVDVQFSFDFGDGSPRTEWNGSRKVSHSYQGSGYYKVKLFARQPAKPERAIVITSMVVKIVDKIEPVDIEFHCFPVIEPEEDSGCNVTVLAGQDLNATIDFGDSTEPLDFTIPDTRFNPLGPLIYDTNSTTYEEAPYGLYILSDSAKSYSSNSNIRALEGISPNGGDLEMIIYRPWCGNNTPCSLGVVSCSPPKVFCLRDKNCIEPSPKKTPGLTGEPGECRSHIEIFPEYKIARRVLITVTKNYFYYHLSKSRDFRIGDLIALRLYDAKLASESTNSTTNLDLVLNSPTGNSGDPPRIIGYETMKTYTSKKLLVRVITYENSEFYLPHLFADNGNYTAKLTLTSPWLGEVKNFTYDMKIAVQTPIDQIRLRVSPPNAVVGQKVAATIRINGGSDVKLTWDFGDGYKTQRKVDFVKLGQKFVESHEFTSPGVYRITVGASNLQNKYATGQTITVQYPITNDWKITSNSPQLLPGTIDLLLTYPVSSNSTEMILPTNASVNILFGDGSTYEWIVPEKWSELPNGEKIFTHRYKYQGHYKIIATMLNLVSTLTLKTDIFLLRRITGFWLETYALPANKKFSSSDSKLPNEIEGKRIDEEESNSDNTLTTSNRHKLSIGSQVKFTFNQTTGDVDKYIVYLNENLLKETPNNKFLFTGKKPGWHNFTFYAYNKIQGRTDPVYRNLYFMKPVSGLELLDVSVDVTKPANKILQINLREIGTDSCVAILYGDSMPFHKSASLFGSPEDCSEGFPNIEVAHYSEINETMIAPYDYTGGPGDYVVTAKAWNAVSGTISTQLTITVLEIDCYVPEVIIYNPSTNYSLATQVWKSKPVQLYSLAKVDCNASITVNKYWQCYSINEETGEQGEPIDLSMLDSYRKTVLYVPPFFLSQGLYSFRFVVDLNNLEPHPLLPFSGHASTYIRIVRSPIIGKMTAGAESRAIRGMGQQLKLAPGIYSIDPDDDSNKNFNIVWYCRRLPNEKLFESNENKEEETEEKDDAKKSPKNDLEVERDDDVEEEADEDKSSGKAKGKGKRGGGSGEEEMAVSNPLWERPAFMEDMGGCFGKGPGRINITDKSIEWPTSVFYAAGFTYEIVVKIDPPDREPSWSGIQLVLLERTPPSITIQCQTPSLCYPHVPLGQKINPVRVGLIGVCNEDCDGTLLYEWTIFGIDSVSGEEHLLTDAANYVVGSNDVKMALGKEFFDRYYPKYGDYFAKLAVINERGDRGESDIFLHINKPPTGGDCNMTSTGHYALLDKHMINCYNWYDPEYKPIEYYGFWIMSKSKGSISFLSYGPERKATLVLPPGEFLVGVDIKDKEGALTRHAITNLTLIPPTQQQFDAFMELKQLENADAAGDQSRMSMISQAVSALMNIDLVDETLLEATTTTTTTTTTTMKPTTGNGTIFAQKSEAKIEEEVKTRSKMFQSVENIMNVDTLNSLETIGSVLSAISGRGKGIDNEAKHTVIRLLNKTINMASTLEVESPQQLIDFCMFAVGTMGAIVNRMTEQLIKKVVLPTDRSKAWGIEYEVEPPDYGESKDYVFDGKSSVEESLARAVILSERKLGEEQIKQMVGLTIDLVLAILRNIVVGEKPLTFAAPSGLSLTIEMFNGGGLSNKSIQHGDATYIFPEVCSILTTKEACHGNETMGIMAVSWPSILESFGNSVDLLSEDTQTLQLIVLDEDLRILDVSNATDYFSIIIPRSLSSDSLVESNEVEGSLVTGHGSGGHSSSLPVGDFIVPKPRKGESMQYHKFLVTKAYSALNIEITPTNPSSRLILFLHYKSKPFLSLHEVSIPLGVVGNQKGSTHDIFLGNSIIANRTGFFYLGIVCVNESAIRDSSYSYLLDDMMVHTNLSMNISSTTENVTSADWMMRTFDTNYTLRIYTSGCYFYDYSEKIWSGKGCYVATADAHMTHCKCNHLTSFGSGFFIMPNTIDFSYVFANAGFVDNITIYLTVILTLVVYISLVIWARAADRADLRKLGATPLPDNDPKDKYLYEITVYTGDKEASETDSKVSFILSGDDDETDVRSFSDPERKIFRRGAQDIFVMAVPRKLGRLTYLRIWHDNSGSGRKRSWFLNFIVIRDVQTGEKFEFICNKWFAVEKGDGVIDRLIPVAGLGEATEFSHLFHNKTSKGLKDGHLWFSVFLRPTRSRFTRVQRVSCCMAMLYLSMLVNAMWYEKAPPKPRASALEFGPFTLSPEQIGIGFMSNLIVFPPTFLIVLFFRKSRLRRLRPSRLEETAKRQGIPYKKLTHDSGSASASTVSPIATIDRPSITDSPVLGGTISTVHHDPAFGMTSKTSGVGKSKRTMKKPKKQFLFPWWCRYIGWALCVICMVVSVFFLWAYGVQFGDKKTRQWLTSLVISFFASILITQPIKVFLTAIILSTIFKAPDADVDESEQDEEDIDLELRPDEEWLHDLASMSPHTRRRGGRRAKYYRPPNLTALERAKLERLKEIQMGIILKDIFSYLVFLWLLIVLSYGNRDPNAFLTKDAVKATFIKGANTGTAFTSVSTTEGLWEWIEKTLIPELLVGPWYNDYQPYGMRGFLNDRVNRVMGYGVLRSTRVRESTCSMPGTMEKLLKSRAKCRSFGNIIFEDRRSYGKGWTPFNFTSLHTSIPKKGSLTAPVNSSLALTPSPDYEEMEMDDAGPLEEGITTKLPGEDIMLVNPSKSKKTPWQYRKPSELDGLPFWGLLDVYSGGGYTIPLKGSRASLLSNLAILKNNSWIDSRTRSVFAEFSAYNPQVNLFTVVTIVAEFQPGGGIVPNYRIDVVRLIRYHLGFGLFVILCELSYVCFIIYFTVREIKKLRSEGFYYFTSYWNWAELFIIICSYVAIGLYIYRSILTHRILKIFDRTHGNGYIKLQYVTFIDELFGYIMAFVIFIGILKFIRLLRFNKRMGLLYSTLHQCSKDLKSFCIVFLIVFFAFVQLFYLLFGTSLPDFSSFINAAETSFGMVTGKFDFEAMVTAAPTLGPLSFFIFVLIAQIVLVNIFLTLIISAFETVKHDIAKQNNEFEMVNFVLNKFKEILGIDGHGSVHPGSYEPSNQTLSIHEQMKLLPEKVDQFIAHIDDLFYSSAKTGSSPAVSVGATPTTSKSLSTSKTKYTDLMNASLRRSNVASSTIMEANVNDFYPTPGARVRTGGRAARRARRQSTSTPQHQRNFNQSGGGLLDWQEISSRK